MSFKDYLPSRELQKKLIAFAIIVLIFLVVFFIFKSIKFLIEKKSINKQIKNLPVELRDQVNVLTIGELQKKDTNGNSIPDWEERLYGLDPLTNGDQNKKIIEEKKSNLKLENGNLENDNQKEKTETEKFAKNFISLVMSLEGSGALSDNALSNISTAASESLSDYKLPDYISSWHIKTVDNSVISRDKYINTLLLELVKISNINDSNELKIISDSISSKTDIKIMLTPLVEIYRQTAVSLKDAYVPKELLSQHLTIVNSLYNIATGIDNIKYISTDPARASKGISQYQVYSETLNKAVNEVKEKY